MHRQHFGNVKLNFCPPPAHSGQRLEQPYYAPETDITTNARPNTARFLITAANQEIDDISSELIDLIPFELDLIAEETPDIPVYFKNSKDQEANPLQDALSMKLSSTPYISDRDISYVASLAWNRWLDRRDRGQEVVEPAIQRSRTESQRISDEAAQEIKAINRVLGDVVQFDPNKGFPEHRFGNPELPATIQQDELINALNSNQWVMLTGPTGSGKSIVSAQAIMQAGCDNIIMAEPRRYCVSSLAERIDVEVKETLGEELGSGLVGMRTQVVNTLTDKTRINVYTDGIIANVVLGGDFNPTEKTVIIVDEVHEQNKNMFLILGALAKLTQENPNIFVVIASASMNQEPIQKMITTTTGMEPAIVELEGRLYDVDMQERPKSTVTDTVLELIQNEDEGDILVFLPDIKSIKRFTKDTYRKMTPAERANNEIFPLYSRQSPAEQARATAPYNGRKIIASTNIAQTSVTIPGITSVVSSGVAREIRLDKSIGQVLSIVDISQSDCIQQAGRAGRVEDGKFFLTRLDKDRIFKPLADRPQFQIPEILRTPYAREMLRAEAMGWSWNEFPKPYPIKEKRDKRQRQELRHLGAMDDAGNVTEMGQMMNKYSLGLSGARMMEHARRHHHPVVGAYVAAVAASIEAGGLPYYVHTNKGRWEELVTQTSSDHLAQLELFVAAQGKTRMQLTALSYDVKNTEQARTLYEKITRTAGIPAIKLHAPTLRQTEAILECIFAGTAHHLYQQAGRAKGGKAKYRRMNDNDEEPRQITNRTHVTEEPKYAVGEPYGVEVMKKKGRVALRSVLRHVTQVRNLNTLGRVAGTQTWQQEGYAWRNGKVYAVERQMLAGIPLDQTRERPADPSAEVHQAVIKAAMDQPGAAQRYLREIKKKTEEFAHLAKDPIKVVNQRMLEGWIHHAAPSGVISPGQIDENLRQWIVSEKISLETFIPQKLQQQILRNAPNEIDLGHMTLDITYRRGVPVAHHFRATEVAKLQNEVRLADGRIVHFYYDKKRHTIESLRKRLAGPNNKAQLQRKAYA
jgi:HrpA-like RNA helicase